MTPAVCPHCLYLGVVRCDAGHCDRADPTLPYDFSMCRPCWVQLGGLKNYPTTAAVTRPLPHPVPLLGDVVHKALSSVGVTPESLSGWLGGECGCKERQEKLNALDRWARRVAAGRVEQAGEFLKKILGSDPESLDSGLVGKPPQDPKPK